MAPSSKPASETFEQVEGRATGRMPILAPGQLIRIPIDDTRTTLGQVVSVDAHLCTIAISSRAGEGLTLSADESALDTPAILACTMAGVWLRIGRWSLEGTAPVAFGYTLSDEGSVSPMRVQRAVEALHGMGDWQTEYDDLMVGSLRQRGALTPRSTVGREASHS